MNAQDVVIKKTQPLRIVEARGVAPALAPEYIGRVFLALSPQLIDHLQRAGARPGILVHYYDQPAQDGSYGVHVGYEIGEQLVSPSEGIEVVDLPVLEVASIIHRGGTEGIVAVYEALIRWIENSDYRLAGYGRELYHEMTADGPSVIELQLPVAG